MSIIRIGKTEGFSLLEVMLVILILSMIAVFALRMQGPKFRETLVDRSATQIKQIMEAATSYYIDNGTWPITTALQPSINAPYPALYPSNITMLTGAGNTTYLPNTILDPTKQNTMISPFGTPYLIGPAPGQIYGGPGDSATLFEIEVDTKDPQIATLLKSKLPLSFVSNTTVITAYVNIPSYDYNHAKALSDVGVYHPGDCIPVPSYACPTGLQAATFVTLEQAYGFGIDPSQTSEPDDTTVYPITGSSAYVIPGTGAHGNPISADKCPSTATTPPSSYILPDAQEGSPAKPANAACPTGEDRVCVDIRTSNGPVIFDTNRLNSTYVLAMTKCVPTNY